MTQEDIDWGAAATTEPVLREPVFGAEDRWWGRTICGTTGLISLCLGFVLVAGYIGHKPGEGVPALKPVEGAEQGAGSAPIDKGAVDRFMGWMSLFAGAANIGIAANDHIKLQAIRKKPPSPS